MLVSILVSAYFQDTMFISIHKAGFVIQAKSFYGWKPGNLILCFDDDVENHDFWNLHWKTSGFWCPLIHSFSLM